MREGLEREALNRPPLPVLTAESGSGVCSTLLGPSDLRDSLSESRLWDLETTALSLLGPSDFSDSFSESWLEPLCEAFGLVGSFFPFFPSGWRGDWV